SLLALSSRICWHPRLKSGRRRNWQNSPSGVLVKCAKLHRLRYSWHQMTRPIMWARLLVQMAEMSCFSFNEEECVNNAEVINLAQSAHIQLVRFLYCDHSGVTRAKAIHVSHLAHKLREGIGLTRAQMAMNLLEQLIDIDGMEPVGEIRLVPDPETFSILPWTPGSASLICDQLDHTHMNWGSCPRCFLKDMVARAEQMGIKVEATFENEFYLAREQDG